MPTKNRASASWPALRPAVHVPVELSYYSLEVIYGAAYALMDRAYVLLRTGQDGVVDVHISGKENLDPDQLHALGGVFVNELADQVLRQTLDESGRKIREYIVAKAHFFHDDQGRNVQNLLDAAMLEAFDDDPLDIAVPWEEKYGDDEGGAS